MQMPSLLHIAIFLVGLLFLAYILRKILLRKLNQQDNTNLWWVSRPLDKLARHQNSCQVLRTLEDMELDDCQIEIVDLTCESGLPHTSDANTIRMTEDVWNSPTRDSTLKHERIHILQRRYPDQWRRFYQEHWGYTLHAEPPTSLPSSDALRFRANPDTATEPWVSWMNRYWFAPLYSDTVNPRLSDVSIQLWDSETSTWLSEPPEEWRRQFCGDGKCPHQWEHPHEIAAELWTADAFDTPAGYSLKNFMHHLLSP